MAPPEPLPAPGKIAHHGYEYADCALLICVSHNSAAAMTKSVAIGVRDIVFLPVVVLAWPHNSSFDGGRVDGASAVIQVFPSRLNVLTLRRILAGLWQRSPNRPSR